jgi:bifunctional NMN adenylyltransferase/nudix hydrolase
MPLYDHPYNDQAWIRGVQDAVDQVKTSQVDTLGLNPTAYITGSDRDHSTWYLKTFGDFFIDDTVDAHPEGFDLSATNIRKVLFKEGMSSTAEILNHLPHTTVELLQMFQETPEYAALRKEYAFIESYKDSWKVRTNKIVNDPALLELRKDALVAMVQDLRSKIGVPYAPIFSTTDCVVIQSGHVLVNVRDEYPGKGLWALPGGFLEQDETLMAGAIRELIEETSIELSKAQLIGSIKAKEIFDHPGRSLRGRTITTAFLLKLDDSKPLPRVKPQKGEVKKVTWLTINEALKHPENWFEDHFHILQTMYSRISQA